jgi:hypothetical protein
VKTLLKLVGGLVVVAVVLLLIARVVGFDPGPTRPGLWMTGEVVTEPVTDWTFALKVPGLTGIQTRQPFFPALAHSVLTTRFVYNRRLYLGSGYPAGIKLPDGRHWNSNVMADPTVRIRIGNKLYDKKLVYVSDPIERDEVCKAYGPMFWSPGFFLHLWRVEPLT